MRVVEASPVDVILNESEGSALPQTRCFAAPPCPDVNVGAHSASGDKDAQTLLGRTYAHAIESGPPLMFDGSTIVVVLESRRPNDFSKSREKMT